MTKHITLLLCSILIFSCKTKKIENTPNINRKWILIAFEDFKTEDLMAKNCFLDLTDKVNSLANMGCNTLGFEYTITKDKIHFGMGRTTHMYCEEHQIESRFLNVVPTIKSYKIEDQNLYLKTNSGQELIFIAAIASDF